MSTPIPSLEPTATAQAGGRFGAAAQAAAVPVPATSVLPSGAADPEPETPPVDPQALREAVQAAVEQLQSGTALSYRVDKELDRVIVEVRDRVSGEVLRQIPGEEVLRIARNLKNGVGALLNATA